MRKMRFKNWSIGLLLVMLGWLLPMSLWAKDMIIKETYNGYVAVTYEFHFQAKSLYRRMEKQKKQ
jgi:hypothetical protein